MERETKLHALLEPMVGCCITDFIGIVFSFTFGQNEDSLDIGTLIVCVCVCVCSILQLFEVFNIFLKKMLSND